MSCIYCLVSNVVTSQRVGVVMTGAARLGLVGLWSLRLCRILFPHLMTEGADYLVVELHVDIGVLVPPHLAETVLVELQHPVEFFVDVGRYIAVDLRLVLSPRQLTDIYYMVADALERAPRQGRW